ncbi:winged helix-turn-helix transcriptional regulator [Nocardia pseudobrasiliensis]|uniref:HxlR family transcriptional regulator n=1 Tax=Nocardia pseudobrasiliensis TaxID=45979 RepID=A0A370IC83_9NOCA|nr:helix-turn-helix domain-containing protein [Nocardia pseudobrasiliensis]RDI68348.1 HxlR family transcriptional regulator [Nocardia pseudobrasiliensis]
MSDLDHVLPECPIARFLTVLDGPWATLIVRELLTGPKRFTQLRSALAGISPKTLSSRLQRFQETGLVTRTAYAEIPPRVEYELTPAGQRLDVVLATMADWAERDLPRVVTNSDGSALAADRAGD